MIRLSTIRNNLILVYVFLLPMGQLFRFGGEGSYGLSTVIFFAIISLAMHQIICEVRVPKSILIIQIFTLYIICVAIAHLGYYSHFKKSFYLFLYTLLLYAAFRAYEQDEKIAKKIIFILLISSSISSCFTFLNAANIINLSGITGAESNRIEVTYGDTSLVINTGLFVRRTGMASYFIFAISAALMMYFQSNKKKLISLLYLLFAFLPLLSLAITANRSGVLFGILGPILAYALINPRKNIAKILFFGALFYLGLSILSELNPTLKYYYGAFTIADGLSSGSNQARSDMYRIVFFFEALGRLNTNIMGYGFGLLYDVPGMGHVAPHNSITLIIIAAGWVGVLFLLFISSAFLYSLVIVQMGNLSPAGTQLLYIILAMLFSSILFNQVHDGLQNGLLWISLAFYISVLSKSKMVGNKQKYYQRKH